MQVDYPYMISNNKIAPIFESIKNAAKPPKFTHQFLLQLGFSSSNDRAIIPLLKRLGFLQDDGTPTEYYSRLKDSTDHPYVLGERIKSLYSELYSINTEIHDASDDEIKGAFSRITGKEEKTVNRYFATFKSLVSLAKFNERTQKNEKEKQSSGSPIPPADEFKSPKQEEEATSPQFHYNIQIHLPATTDISVYNAIFKSLKENLFM